LVEIKNHADEDYGEDYYDVSSFSKDAGYYCCN